jgi:hypothetical protein
MQHVGLEDLTMAIMKTSVFWGITSCSSLKVSRRFGGICRLSSESKNKPARNQPESGWQDLSINFQLNAWCYTPDDRNPHVQQGLESGRNYFD